MTDQVSPQQPGQPYPDQPSAQQYPGQQYSGQPYPGQPYGAAPQPVPPPKKKRKWPWILGAIVVVIIAISALSGGGSDKSDDSASSGASAPSTAAGGGGENSGGENGSAAAGLNTPVRDGKFEFVVTGVESGLAEVGDNPYLTEKAQGQFVIVSMSVKNIAEKPQSFDPTAQKLVDAQGRSFTNSTTAQIALGGSQIPVWDNINPGNEVQVKVVYDMPAGAVPSSIELHDSMFSGGETVSLK